MRVATLTSKGQVTIPKTVRQSLDLQAGDKIEFYINENGEAFLRPISRKVDAVFGRLHRPEQRPVLIEEMDDAIKEKIKARTRK